MNINQLLNCKRLIEMIYTDHFPDETHNNGNPNKSSIIQ